MFSAEGQRVSDSRISTQSMRDRYAIDAIDACAHHFRKEIGHQNEPRVCRRRKGRELTYTADNMQFVYRTVYDVQFAHAIRVLHRKEIQFVNNTNT
jgi:Leu/Phe-tRNA-protein transferase